jgi:hypothetical protein
MLPPVFATLLPNLSDAAAIVDWTDWWKAAIEPFRCRLSDGLRATREHKPTPSFLYAVASQAYGCYGVYLKRDGDAHAIALRHTRDNPLHIFDANYFHVSAPIRDAKTLLVWYLAAIRARSPMPRRPPRSPSAAAPDLTTGFIERGESYRDPPMKRRLVARLVAAGLPDPAAVAHGS